MAPGVPRGTPAVTTMDCSGAQTFATSNATGAVDHILEVMSVFGHHAMQTPGEGEPAPSALYRRESNDRHAWPLTGRA